jgi:hypothetical protein
MGLEIPSPVLGWATRSEWPSFANNLPFDRIAAFFAQCGKRLIIEFVPKSDPQSRILLRHRVDIFHGYTREAFERDGLLRQRRDRLAVQFTVTMVRLPRWSSTGPVSS